MPMPILDCVELRKAFHGLGCDGPAVISILAHRSAEQRSQIREMYCTMYQEDLLLRIKSELHFNFKKAMLLWVSDPPSRDAFILRDALSSHIFSSSSRRRRILIETLCLQSPEDLRCITEAYSSRFHRSLHDDIFTSTEGICRSLFARYLVSEHDAKCGAEMGINGASEEAKELSESLGSRAGNIDVTVFLRILTTRSRQQLLTIFDAYKHMYGKDVHKALKKEPAEESQETIRAVIKFISNPPRFLAKTLYKSMKGLGTDDDTLIRVVISRAEVDMKDIKSEFVRKYKVSLNRTISSDTSGNYRMFLMALIGANYTSRETFLSRIL